VKTIVVRNIARTEAAVTQRLGALGVSTVHEAYGRAGLMKPYMRPIWPGCAAGGPAVTVLAQPGDNWMIHVAVEQCQPGDMLVVGCTADSYDGMFGELLATSLKARGVVGLVIVTPGDAVVADDDGVVVVARTAAADVAAKGEARRVDEERKRQRLASGELGLDMYNMRDPLARAGLVYVDRPEDA
jgi:4-hydroxy-4-methyl-2-oxoglutarate aldolase